MVSVVVCLLGEDVAADVTLKDIFGFIIQILFQGIIRSLPSDSLDTHQTRSSSVFVVSSSVAII